MSHRKKEILLILSVFSWIMAMTLLVPSYSWDVVSFHHLIFRKDGSRRLIIPVCVTKGLSFILKELASDFIKDLQCCYCWKGRFLSFFFLCLLNKQFCWKLFVFLSNKIWTITHTHSLSLSFIFGRESFSV